MSSFKDFQESQEKARRLADLPRREALSCGPDELVETSWDGHFSGVYLEPHRVEDDILEGEDVTDRRYTVAILGKEKSREEIRRRVLGEAEEFQRRNPPDPDQKALLERILSERSYRPVDHGAPDCTILLREDRER